MATCGAKTRSGQPCQKPPLNGKKRCRLHGGNAGAPKGNQNTKKAGSLYSAFFTPEENEISENLDLTRIDDELKLIKIRLMRALKLEAEQAEQAEALEIDSKSVRSEMYEGEDTESEIVQTVFKRKDYTAIINTLTARIQSLTTQRNTLIGQSLDLELKRLALASAKRTEQAGSGASDKLPTIIELVALK